MKYFLFLFLFLSCFTPAQQTEFNLKGIKQLDFQLRDKNSLNEKTFVKIKTDSKLKLKAAGIEFKDVQAKFIISINEVTSNSFLIWLRIEESFDLVRDNQKIKSEIITYSLLKSFKYGLLENYDEVVLKSVEEMINEFLDQYLTDNQN